MQIFHPSTNTIAKVSILGGVGIAGFVLWLWTMYVRTDYETEVNVVRNQPVPFSHEHHVTGLGLDCRYCHQTVETAAFAGLPATEVCMGCHSQVWKDSPLLAPVRESLARGTPLQWTRVNDVPDFVYFNHSIHIAKGIGCESCHGRVDQMPLLRKAHSLHMEWCLECHEHPDRHIRPQSQVFAFGKEPLPREQAVQLVADKHIALSQLSNCSVCHR